jgi:hypothetical protein
MNPHDPRHHRAHELDREARHQADAEHADAPRDPLTDRYRLIYHALRSAPMPLPPPTFALQMERLTRDHEEHASIETWILRGLAAIALVGGLVLGGPVVVDGLAGSASLLSGSPWPMLAGAGAGLCGAWALDRWLRPGRSAGLSTGN